MALRAIRIRRSGTVSSNAKPVMAQAACMRANHRKGRSACRSCASVLHQTRRSQRRTACVLPVTRRRSARVGMRPHMRSTKLRAAVVIAVIRGGIPFSRPRRNPKSAPPAIRSREWISIARLRIRSMPEKCPVRVVTTFIAARATRCSNTRRRTKPVSNVMPTSADRSCGNTRRSPKTARPVMHRTDRFIPACSRRVAPCFARVVTPRRDILRSRPWLRRVCPADSARRTCLARTA